MKNGIVVIVLRRERSFQRKKVVLEKKHLEEDIDYNFLYLLLYTAPK